MNAKKNYSLADILGLALAPLTQVIDPAIDVESHYVPMKHSAPMPVKAIFNLKTEDMVPMLDNDGNPVYEQGLGENSPKKIVRQAKPLEKPILASKVFFDDGSWTVVKNSGDDTVDIEEKALSNGRTVKAATDASKERAIAYAVVKRVFGRVDPVTKEVKGANLGRRFEKVIKASIDQNIGNAEAGVKKTETEPAQNAKPKKSVRKRCQIDEKSLKKTLDLLGELAKNLNLDKIAGEDQQGA